MMMFQGPGVGNQAALGICVASCPVQQPSLDMLPTGRHMKSVNGTQKQPTSTV